MSMYITWDLVEALSKIRYWQPVCMELGYYLALAGGVLNNSVSTNDLDLVAVPKTESSEIGPLVDYFVKQGTVLNSCNSLPAVKHLTFLIDNKRVDLAIVLLTKNDRNTPEKQRSYTEGSIDNRFHKF